MLEIIVTIATSILLMITLAPGFPSNHWLIRVWEFPRMQIACLAIFFVWLSSLINSALLAYSLMALNCAVAIYQLIWIWPYTIFFPKQVAKTKLAQSAAHIKIMTSNVLMPNRAADKLLALVNQHQPDLLVTLETDTWWQQALSPLHAAYPYRVNQPLDNLYGMHLYSKYPLKEVQVSYLIEQNVPSMHCYLAMPNQPKIKCHFLHPAPPSPTENERATPRDNELLLIAKAVRTSKEPIIVTGDLNDVAWSPTTRAFRRISGLQDPRIGRGMFNTFHAQYPFLRWPLDHIFHSQHFTLADIQRLPSIDSDHFPLLSDLVFNSVNAKQIKANF